MGVMAGRARRLLDSDVGPVMKGARLVSDEEAAVMALVAQRIALIGLNRRIDRRIVPSQERFIARAMRSGGTGSILRQSSLVWQLLQAMRLEELRPGSNPIVAAPALDATTG